METRKMRPNQNTIPAGDLAALNAYSSQNPTPQTSAQSSSNTIPAGDLAALNAYSSQNPTPQTSAQSSSNTIPAGDLAALNAYSSPVSSYLGNTENYLKSAASYGELPIDMAAKAGQAIFNIPSGL